MMALMDEYHGYILTRGHYEAGGRHLLRFTGAGETGPFEVVITRDRPVFFIRREAKLPGHVRFDQRWPVALNRLWLEFPKLRWYIRMVKKAGVTQLVESFIRNTSPWPHPSFQGSYLPAERTIPPKGLQPNGRCPGLARTIPDNGIVRKRVPRKPPAGRLHFLGLIGLELLPDRGLF